MSDHSLYQAVYRYAVRLLSGSQIAQDIVQETFLRLSTLKEPPENERAWLYRTARNLVIDHYRRSSRQSAEPLPESATLVHPAVLVEQKEQIDMLNEKINELSPRHREVLRLKFQENLKYAEIAEVMNEPITTVAWLIHEAIKKLRESFSNHR